MIAREGGPALVQFKVNSLVDEETIDALYLASRDGVKIDLVIRGMCALRPQVPGLSDNIRVRSIVGRFLEHSRIYAFGTGEEADVYLSSADWMPRNFQRRVEVMFPVLQPALKRHVLDQILPVMLADNVKSREMQPDGTYKRVMHGPEEAPLRAQLKLLAGLPREDVAGAEE